jgi:NarL family two-component system response regulator LiaR
MQQPSEMSGCGPDGRIPVMIVDDHPLFREAVGRLLSECREFEIVAEAGDGEEAIALAARESPRVVILDIGLPKLNGIETTREIKSRHPTTAVVVLSVHDDAEHITAVLGAGADAYLTKDVARGEIVHALREVAAGRMFISQSALRHLASSSGVNREAESQKSTHGLTPREQEILLLLAHGFSNREIAVRLSLSTATVKGHVEAVYSKLRVDSRTEAVTTALRMGIVNLSDI